jgi:TIR domain
MASAPSVFMSYSWDSDRHKKWVRDLAKRLVSNGVNVWLDQWHVGPGDSLTRFMEQKIARSGHVLVVCTPLYARKSNTRRGGVGYEQQIISGRIAGGIPRRKFIPIVREGTLEPGKGTGIPTHFSGIYALDMRSPQRSNRNFEELVRAIYRVPKYVPPARGAALWGRAARRPIRLANEDTEGWWLASGVARNQQYPRTFEIPSERARRAIEAGDLAKLAFECRPDEDGFSGERMWVLVTGVEGPYYVGRLNNVPIAIPRLRRGRLITFLPEHIISIIPANDIPATKAALSRTNRGKRKRASLPSRPIKRRRTTRAKATQIST